MKFTRIALAVSIAALTSAAHATVLDFEGLTSNSADSLSGVAGNYGGFSWDSSFFLFRNPPYSAQVGSGQYGIVNNYGTSPANITITSASTFDFTSAFFGGWDFNPPSSVTVNAYDAGNVLIDTANVAITIGVGSVVNFNWTGVSKLEITGGQFYTMDDFTFNENRTVPEPGSLALVALAALAAAGAVRAKKRSV